MSENSFGAKDTLEVGARSYEIFRLDALQQRFDVARLPFSLKVLLENLLRNEGNGSVTAADIEALAGWDAKAEPSKEIAFTPARVLMQDFTGVPGGRRPRGDARRDGRDGRRPGEDQPARAGRARDRPLRAGRRVRHARRLPRNAELEFERNQERYAFLRWGQGAFDDFAVVPPDTGHRPPGQPRVPRARRLRRRARPARPTPTRSSAPTRTRRWSTASACSAGASAGSRPRRRCSASRCRC